MLKAEGIVKGFGGLRAINRCSIEVEKGSIVGLIGPNGAGKTSLFNVLESTEFLIYFMVQPRVHCRRLPS